MYFFFPETTGRSLEEIDAIFAVQIDTWHCPRPKKHAQEASYRAGARRDGFPAFVQSGVTTFVEHAQSEAAWLGFMGILEVFEIRSQFTSKIQVWYLENTSFYLKVVLSYVKKSSLRLVLSWVKSMKSSLQVLVQRYQDMDICCNRLLCNHEARPKWGRVTVPHHCSPPKRWMLGLTN